VKFNPSSESFRASVLSLIPRLRATSSASTLEKGFARIFWIEESQAGAFRGKLKHLQKLGLPGGRHGKGRRIAYTRELAFQLLIALLLGELGIDPVLVVQAVKEHWKTVLAPAVAAAIDRGQATNPVYLVVRPKLMSGGGLQISKFQRYPYPGAPNDTNLRDEFDRQVGGAQTWFCAIDLTRFAVQLDMLLS
jgi:hypothetical protein